MKNIDLRVLCVILSVWCMVGNTAQAQPAGNYGPEDVRYVIPSGAYYVSPGGNGSLPCSQRNPCSLSKALSSSPSGTTIVLRGGTYRTSGFDARIPRKLILQPYPGEKVILKGSDVASSWKADGALWKTSWSRLYPPGSNTDISKLTNAENPMAVYQDMVFVNGTPLKQVSTRTAVVPGTFYIDYSKQLVYIGTNPANSTIEITASKWGLHTYNVSASGITIRGLKFMHYAETGVMIQSPAAVIEHNEFVHNAVAGIKIYNAKRVQVRHNLFHANGCHGAGINGSDYLVFENNLVTENNTEKYNRNSWSAGGVKILLSPYAVVRNNFFHRNDGNGVWLDHSSNFVAIVNNLSTKNTRMGIHCEISDHVIIAGNVATDNGYNYENLAGAGIGVSNSSDVRVYNNTLVNNEINLQIADISRAGSWITRNTIVKNNILSDASIQTYPSAEVWVRKLACDDVVVKEMEHNAYHKTNPNQPDMLVRWKVGDSSCEERERIETLARLTDSFGFGKNSLEFFGTEDPFFVDRSTGNYQLKQGSYAIRAGESLPADIAAMLGWEVSGSVDMGAYQSSYATSPSSPTAPSMPISGNMPWHENFELPNGAYVDNGLSGGTAWSLQRDHLGSNAIVEVQNMTIIARGTVNEAVWRSEQIKLGGNRAKFSLDISSLGNLESGTDYIRVYYRLDNGSEILAGEAKGNIAGIKTVSAESLQANILQIVVRMKNSDLTERYFLDNILVNWDDTQEFPAPSIPVPPLPWIEDFNAADGTFKGYLETERIYKNGRMNVREGKLSAQGVGQAAFVSDTIDIQGKPVDFSVVLSSAGSLESGSDDMKVYYRLDNGSEILAGEVKGNIEGEAVISVEAIEANTLQIIVRIRNSDITEYYFIDDLQVEAVESALPWVEDFNATDGIYKGSIDKTKAYTNAIVDLQDGKLVARGVGEIKYESEEIKLSGQTVDFAVSLSSKGVLESKFDHIKVYYILDQGDERLAGQVSGNIEDNKVVSIKGISGSVLQIKVVLKNSDITEHYFVDEIAVHVSGSHMRTAKKTKPTTEILPVAVSHMEVAGAESSISVYPNPVSSYLNVKVNGISPMATFIMTDASGQNIYQSQISNNEILTLDVSHLHNGLYTLQIIDQMTGSKTIRILKK